MNARAFAAQLAQAKAALERQVEEAERAPRALTDDVPVLEYLQDLEDALVAKGWPALSPWWRATIARWYRSGKRYMVSRVGRRGGKSTSWCRVGVLEALHGEHDIPPGDVGVVAIISVDRREAARRIRTIKQILDVIGVAYGPIDGGIILRDRPIAFQCFTASIAGVSGFTSIFILCDEVSKWRDADTLANPATEVLASLRPTMSTQPNARMVLSSSPLGTLDAHAEAFDRGETDEQCVAFATSWDANPTLTEAQTHIDEPDEGRWMREYAGIPLEDTETGIFGSALLDKCERAAPMYLPPMPGWSYVAATDPATRGNAWTLIVRTADMANRRIVVLHHEWRGSITKPLDSRAVFEQMASMLKPYGITHVLQDIASYVANRVIAAQNGLTLGLHTMGSGEQVNLYETVRTWMADGQVELPKDAQVRSDLLGVRRRLTATGVGIRLANENGRHSDYAPALAIALSQHCAMPRKVAQGEAEQVEADALRRDTQAWKRKNGKGKRRPWWQESKV